ncbi:MAG: trypsin-like peptidase domain-containing protein [Candidatus Bathyarchaeia archaeon]
MSDAWFYDSEPQREKRNWLPVLVVLLILSNIGLVAYFSLFYAPDNLKQMEREVNQLQSELDTVKLQLSSTRGELEDLKSQMEIGEPGNTTKHLQLTYIYKQIRRSVVLISVTTSQGDGQGSGFIYNEEGHIITNNHVVEDAKKITVTFTDGTITEAEIVGTDPYSDLAVIAVDLGPETLVPVYFSSSSDLLVGEQVVAIGAPYGLDTTMTAGIVSATGRQMSAPGGYSIVDVIQTDAAINPGNSGGPLLNIHGEVVGMNTAIVSSTLQFSGIGFAIPSDTITREASSLIEEGRYEHPLIGITGRELTPGIVEAMDLPPGTRGTLVIDIMSGGPAEEAGLQGGDKTVKIDGSPTTIGGDVIIGIDNRTVPSFYDLIFYIERYKQPGDTVTLTIIRDGKVMNIDLTLGVRPPPES